MVRRITPVRASSTLILPRSVARPLRRGPAVARKTRSVRALTARQPGVRQVEGYPRHPARAASSTRLLSQGLLASG
jgi:hypothetical protein